MKLIEDIKHWSTKKKVIVGAGTVLGIALIVVLIKKHGAHKIKKTAGGNKIMSGNTMQTAKNKTPQSTQTISV